VKSRAIKHEHLRRYLLGTLEIADQERLEKRMLTDADFQESLSVTENEIVYEYLTGALSEPERERFDRHFLCTPERQQKLKFFYTLIRSIDNLPKPLSDAHLPPARRPFFPFFFRRENVFLRLSFAVGVLLLLLGVGWLFIQNRSGKSAGGGSSQLAAYTVTLSPSQLRAVDEAQTARVSVPSGVKEVKFLLPLSAGVYPSYRAVLATHGGGEKFETTKLGIETAANARNAYLTVPSSILIAGDYQLKLYGLTPGDVFEEVDVYNFRVTR
jgi:hypothetical protein